MKLLSLWVSRWIAPFLTSLPCLILVFSSWTSQEDNQTKSLFNNNQMNSPNANRIILKEMN